MKANMTWTKKRLTLKYKDIALNSSKGKVAFAKNYKENAKMYSILAERKTRSSPERSYKSTAQMDDFTHTTQGFI